MIIGIDRNSNLTAKAAQIWDAPSGVSQLLGMTSNQKVATLKMCHDRTQEGSKKIADCLQNLREHFEHYARMTESFHMKVHGVYGTEPHYILHVDS
jgi:hypothetical protein